MSKENSCQDNGTRLSDDQLWAKAKSNEPIIRSDVGIEKNNNSNGIQLLNEGLDLSLFNAQGNNNK